MPQHVLSFEQSPLGFLVKKEFNWSMYTVFCLFFAIVSEESIYIVVGFFTAALWLMGVVCIQGVNGM